MYHALTIDAGSSAGLSWILTAVAAAIVTVLVGYRVATRNRRRRPW
ncbi:hypothetical protein AB0C10_21275 [Microbispora amethystogenes]